MARRALIGLLAFLPAAAGVLPAGAAQAPPEERTLSRLQALEEAARPHPYAAQLRNVVLSTMGKRSLWGRYRDAEDGRRYLDLYGGHAVTVLGHSHPKWVEAISRQAARLGFYSSVSYLAERGEAARLLVEES